MFTSEQDFLEFVNYLLSPYNFSVVVRHFICCQSALETGFGTSRICSENCNLFGMKKPTIRPTTCVGSLHGHAKYNQFRDSVSDYMLWLAWCKPLRYRLNTVSAYSDFLLIHHYAQDKDYISKILNLYNIYYG